MNPPPQVGHKIPGAEMRAQIMQLTKLQLAQIVSSAVSQALTQHLQHIASSSLLAAEAITAAVQQVQVPTKFEMAAFEGKSAASGLTWSQRVVDQARHMALRLN